MPEVGAAMLLIDAMTTVGPVADAAVAVLVELESATLVEAADSCESS